MKVDESLFYELVSLKGELKAKTWDELFRKLIDRRK